MNRRSFLHIFGAGLPAVVVAEKFGLIERVRSYFFAPKGGWSSTRSFDGREIILATLRKALFEMQRDFDLSPVNVHWFMHPVQRDAYLELARPCEVDFLSTVELTTENAPEFAINLCGARVVADRYCPQNEVHLRAQAWRSNIHFDKALLVG